MSDFYHHNLFHTKKSKESHLFEIFLPGNYFGTYWEFSSDGHNLHLALKCFKIVCLYNGSCGVLIAVV